MCVIVKNKCFFRSSIFLNQSKTKTILHTVFETIINKNCRFFELKMLEIFARAFFSSKSLLKPEVVYSGSFKCYKVFSSKIMKENSQKDGSQLKEAAQGYIQRIYIYISQGYTQRIYIYISQGYIQRIYIYIYLKDIYKTLKGIRKIRFVSELTILLNL